jgi:hypothetical protein
MKRTDLNSYNNSQIALPMSTAKDLNALGKVATYAEEQAERSVSRDIVPVELWKEQKYNAFPVRCTRFNTPYLFIKSATSHAAAGSFPMSKFENNDWTIPEVVTVGGTPLNSIDALCAGCDEARICIAWQAGLPLVQINYAYNDDGSKNFIAAGSVAKRVDEDFVASGFKIIKMVTKRLNVVYSGNATQSRIYLHESSDDGVTWTAKSTNIFQGLISNAYPTPGNLSEAEIEVIELGTTDATTKLICVVRDDTFAGLFHQFSSNDGGDAWTYRGLFSTDDIGALSGHPPTMERLGANLIVATSARLADASLGLGTRFNIRFKIGNALAVYTDPTQFSLWHTVGKSVSSYKYASADYGYIALIRQNGSLWPAYYDAEADANPVTDPGKNMSIKIIPLLDQHFVEVANTANQSVPTGTATALVFDKQLLNGTLIYNQVNGKFTFQASGYYRVSFQILPDLADESGTYRKAGIEVIDPGNFGSSNPTYEAYSHRFKDFVTRKTEVGISEDLGIIRFVSRDFWAEKGQQFIPQFIHNATGSLNIINTGIHTRAYLSCVKL